MSGPEAKLPMGTIFERKNVLLTRSDSLPSISYLLFNSLFMLFPDPIPEMPEKQTHPE